MNTFAKLLFVASTLVTSFQAKAGTALCTYQTGGHYYDNIVEVDYDLNNTVKGLWFAPRLNVNYDEQVYAGDCSRQTHFYSCINSQNNKSIHVVFTGAKLLLLNGGKSVTIYSCSK